MIFSGPDGADGSNPSPTCPAADDSDWLAAPCPGSCLAKSPTDRGAGKRERLSQFREMGRDDARELGVALLAATLRDPGLIATEGARLDRWIDSLAIA
jgi:hypothetical protein